MAAWPRVERWFAPAAAVVAERPNLTVKVHREGFDPFPLGQVVPVLSGDNLQVCFRVPSGVHTSLAYVDGGGQLAVLQSYPPLAAAYEAVWPGSGKGRTLTEPAGTEFLFVCGRAERPVTVKELQAAWDAGGAWPALTPDKQVLRVRPDEVTVEGRAYAR